MEGIDTELDLPHRRGGQRNSTAPDIPTLLMPSGGWFLIANADARRPQKQHHLGIGDEAAGRQLGESLASWPVAS
jgi:hypothetical protein